MRTPFILIIARPPLHIQKSLIPGLIREISVPRVVTCMSIETASALVFH